MTDTAPPRGARRRLGPILGPLLRAAGVVATTLAAATGAVALGSEPVLVARAQVSDGVALGDLPLDLLLGCLAALALACCVLWLAIVTTATAVEAVTGASLTAVRAVSPSVVRRIVLVCCGAAVGGTSVLSPATALSGEASPPALTRVAEPGERAGSAQRVPATTNALARLALPDRTEGSAPSQRPGRHRKPARHKEPATRGATARAAVVTAASEPASTATVAERGRDRTHRVRAGESLWSIAERLLPGTAPSRLDAMWRRIYRLNHREIGADPDLIIPGTILQLPTESTQPHHRPGDRGTDHRKDAS